MASWSPEAYGLSPTFKLTGFAKMKGWGCKVPQATLQRYLKLIGRGDIGSETPDVSVVPTKAGHLISTIDFFYPLVENPYTQGRIAACNVLSDLYAMGV